MTQIDKKLIIGILFIIVILISGISLIIFNDSSDEPSIIEDDDLTKSDIASNINEIKNSQESYEIDKEVSLSEINSSTRIDISTQRIYSNNLKDAYRYTNIDSNGTINSIESYVFNNTQYISYDESSTWDVESTMEVNQLFEYVEIINENNIDSYNKTHDIDNGKYIFEIPSNEKSIDILNNILIDAEKEKLDKEFRFTSAQNTSYTVIVNDESYNIESIHIESTVYTSNETYNAEIKIDNFDSNIDSITLPDELSSDENIYTDTYYSFINISQTTENNLEVSIEEDVSDIVQSINIITQENEFNLDGQEGDSILLSPNEDFNFESPNIRVTASMNSGDTRIVGEHKLSDNIDVENE